MISNFFTFLQSWINILLLYYYTILYYDNDPRLKGRNCGFFEELKRETERGERDREKEKGREVELGRKKRRRKVRAREGHEETESKAPGK